MRDRFCFDPSDVPVDPGALLDHGRPLHVEVGFGKDVRILRAAAADPDALFLGIEISRKKAASFCRKVARAGLRNVRALCGDVRLLAGELPAGSVASFTILFPDPWPKRRHRKHRWIGEDTARLLVRALAAGGLLIVATDHDGYRDQIRTVLASAGLQPEHESAAVPEEDKTLYSLRFERRGRSVTYMRWRKRLAASTRYRS